MAKAPRLAQRLLIAIVVTVGGLTTACGSVDADTSSAGGQRYSAERVDRGCDLLDLSVLDRWEPHPSNRSGDKKITELGTVLTCHAENSSIDTDHLAAVNLRAVLHTDKGAALTGYEMSLDYAKRASGVGVDVAVPSLGERAAYVYENKTSGPTGNSRYPRSNLQLSLLDGPLEVHLIMTVAAPITEQELLAAATEQMQRITTTLDA